MKVAELKKELKARGLNTTGTKQELVERLSATAEAQTQDSFEDGVNDSEMLDEDDVLGEVEGGEFDDDDDITAEAALEDDLKAKATAGTPALVTKRQASLVTDAQEPQPKKRVLVRPTSVSSTDKENGEQGKDQNTMSAEIKPTEKKIIKLSGISYKERLELRAQKFGTPLSDAAKKEARAARFGSDKTTSSPVTTTSSKITFLGPSEEVLKKRAERFGGNISISAIKGEEEDKLKKRQERFGLSAATASSLEEKKKLRAQRFNM